MPPHEFELANLYFCEDSLFYDSMLRNDFDHLCASRFDMSFEVGLVIFMNTSLM